MKLASIFTGLASNVIEAVAKKINP